MTNNSTFCVDPEDITATTLVEILTFTSIMVAVVAGNTLVLSSFIFCKKLHQQISNYLILNLSITDFLLGIFILPFELVQLIDGTWILGQAFCSVWLTAQLHLCFTSILSLLLITLDKYANITRPLQYSHKVTARRIVIALIVLWLLAALVTWTPVIFGEISTGQLQDNCGGFECQTHWSIGLIWYATICGFIIPFVVLFYTNVKIYRIARRQSRQISQQTSSAGPRRPPLRAIMMTVLLVFTFSAMWMPYFMSNIIRAYYPDHVSLIALTNYCSWLGYTNSAVNPFLYTHNKDFKQAYWKLLPCLKKSRTSTISLSGAV